VKFTAEQGSHEIRLAFLNDVYDGSASDPQRRDRNLHISSIELQTPPVEPALPDSHRQLITKMPQPGEERTVAKEILGNFAQRAYRRAVSEAEVDRLVGFVDLAMQEKGTFLEGIQVAVQATLCSPHFLYRWELDDQLKPGEIRNLSDYELASRLSYFLWSSMPDAELFAVAAKGDCARTAIWRSRSSGCFRTGKRAVWSRTSAANGCRRGRFMRSRQIPMFSRSSIINSARR
jgi:hypothetical protein